MKTGPNDEPGVVRAPDEYFFSLFFVVLYANKCFIDSINNIVPAQPQPQQQRQQLSQ